MSPQPGTPLRALSAPLLATAPAARAPPPLLPRARAPTHRTVTSPAHIHALFLYAGAVNIDHGGGVTTRTLKSSTLTHANKAKREAALALAVATNTTRFSYK